MAPTERRKGTKRGRSTQDTASGQVTARALLDPLAVDSSALQGIDEVAARGYLRVSIDASGVLRSPEEQDDLSGMRQSTAA